MVRWLKTRFGRKQARRIGCLACGICCELYGHSLAATPADRERWAREGRKDLLARVGPEGELWVEPESGEHLECCPFLVRTGTYRAHCGIHATKPDLCREYPTPVHGLRCVRGIRFPRGPEGTNE